MVNLNEAWLTGPLVLSNNFNSFKKQKQEMFVNTICQSAKSIFTKKHVLVFISNLYVPSYNVILDITECMDQYKLAFELVDTSVNYFMRSKYTFDQVIVVGQHSAIQKLLQKAYHITHQTWLVYGGLDFHSYQPYLNNQTYYYFLTSTFIENYRLFQSIQTNENELNLVNFANLFLILNQTSGIYDLIQNSSSVNLDSIIEQNLQNQTPQFELAHFKPKKLNTLISSTDNWEIVAQYLPDKSVYFNPNSSTKMTAKPSIDDSTYQYSFHNKKLMVCALEYDPFFNRINQTGPFHIDNISGVVKKILLHLAKKFKFTPVIYQPTDGQYGVKVNGTSIYTGCVGDVQVKNASMAAGIFTFNPERKEAVDYSYPINFDPLAIIYMMPEKKITWWSFLNSLTPGVWACLFGCLIGMGIASTILSKYSPFSAYNLKLSSSIRDEVNFFENIWMILGSSMFQGQDYIAYAISTRMVTAICWLFSAIFFAVYSAELTSYLTTDTGTKLPNTIQEFEASSLQLYLAVGYSATSSLKSSTDPTLKKMYDTAKFTEHCYVDLMEFKTPNMACITDFSWIEFIVNKYCGKLNYVQEKIESTFTGFLLPKYAEYKPYFDDEIRFLSNKGIITEWFKEDITAASSSPDSSPQKCAIISKSAQNNGSVPSPIDFGTSATGIFFITLACYAVGMVLLACELVYYRTFVSH